MTPLEQNYGRIASTFFNIYSLFLIDKSLRNEVSLKCLEKWSMQLDVDPARLEEIKQQPDYTPPANKQQALERVYDLVYMIYLDGVVEDDELKVTSEYAEKLDLPPYIVGDLLKAIVTAPADGISADEVRNELKELLEVHL
ncbi:hypothetical protein AB9P05_07345 [Roseivirga sp. BDSF3-8]|uniref:hypothetical protein n=1 Tax=Roseivirga sp. BDSF3-8 TaxID=3241598 RepID=UPI0035320E36